ncbi:hypothetical protein BDP27DRAFT_1406274 [Rhodocollybia butyracea]|uniref:Uncharacterized protein n=1 Tax=Rhodocollybia butyracea TaxID=206335 RepID=A0A9P5U080_9AGAR|nr:hypothetical protein BDP27DRAFT_1406274 [Rhodocollybia butyracea]
MAPIRAYYLPADSTSAIDASHPVSAEHLNVLGWKLLSIGASRDEIEQASQKLAQELGFPVTQEGCIVPFHYDLPKNAPTVAPEVVIMVALLTKLVEVDDSNICLANEAVIAITSGGRFLNVEGAKYRLAFDEQNREAAGISFFKETVSNIWIDCEGSD